ncbi:zf-HC2 domain-containing protein [Rubinisphaera sp.]|uniref:zf-HC2 domain-containing protein n=1 Tax=Rubinisphaera sp. TaxID=2024857 RepID=UPI000C0E633D|nr:zf-HC2 domain-containing protein [Rubinisphaera sp.]MBV09235.1 hypothetical protein [Rubinisphaera sp.]HCS50362.1 hypothetical protein [Planctomycetaceae bacterium]|tara:strand:+ start:464 stop:868 length:405 start_codon:yes stop_codon:yes gene_type:complete
MTNPEKHDNWTDCRGGEIASLSHRLRQKRESVNSRRRIMYSSITAAMLIIGVGLGLVMTQLPTNHPDGLACAEVADYSKDYFAHQLKPEIVDRIEMHLDHCKRCRDHYAEYQEDHSKQHTKHTNTALLPVLAFR